jgi:elongation of very long chain fatty acids protein 4
MELLNSFETGVRSALPPAWNQWIDASLKHQHPLAKDLPLMNPFHVILIIAAYLISLPVGRAIMKNRKRLELKGFSMLHNSFLIVLSLYMCVESLRQAWSLGYGVAGNPVEETAKGLPLARVLWIFYFSKILEFVDTWIMILKKNDHQISFLHVYHHSTIFFIWWVVVYYAPGGDSYFSAAQNSFVHVWMYLYYLLASLGVEVVYKKYITVMQMTQFLINLGQALYDMVVPTPFPANLAKMLFFYMISLLILFGNFYVKSGRQPRRAKTGEQPQPDTKKKI